MASNDTLQVNTKRRPHSNTVSGGHPPALDISLSRPTNARRNSEGSPGLPPPICVSEPTPIEPSADAKMNGFFNNHASRPTSPSEPAVAATEQNKENSKPSVRGSATAPVGSTMFDSPASTPKKKSRSRASSGTSNLLNDIKESSTIQSLASKIKSRHSSEENGNGEPIVPAERNSSEGNVSVATASIAGTSGIDVASAKRNQDFHALFRSVPEEDSLIEDFGCALQKEILLQGRIYISENYLCFNANIFGWLVIAFADIVDIEKKTTAYFIPNAIQISTDNAKHFFASFLSRDQAYDLMVDIWGTVKPNNDNEQESSNQNEEDVSSSECSDDDSGSYYESDTEDSYTDEDEEEDSAQMEVTDAAVTRDETKEKNRARKESMASLPNTKEVKSMDAAARRRAMSEAIRPSFMKTEEKAPKTAAANEPTANNKERSSSNGNGGSTAVSDKAVKEAAPKAQVHEKTECGCSSSDHYPNVVMDQVYNGTLEKIYNLTFDSGFMKKFLLENQKSTELEMGEWKKGEGNIEYVKEMSYIKPLGGAIGPKQTKCIITQEVLHQDIEKYVTVLSTTCTPDVPSGSSFSCKTLTCMTWAGKGKVRVLVTVQVEFTKSSWLKSTIEKASIDGQQTYYKDLDTAVRAYCKEHPNEFIDYSKRSSGGKRKKRSNKLKTPRSPKPEPTEQKEEKPKSMIHQVLGSVSNVLADGITLVIDMITSPKSTHLTLFCLLAMVVINIYIARKMAFVEQQLSQLSHGMPNFDGEGSVVVDKSHIPGAHRREYNRQEEQDLWEWLGRMDPDKSSEKREQITFSTSSDPKNQEAIWDDAIKVSQSAKDRLDKHMMELSSMIQRAESNLQDVTKSVNEQRLKMQQQEQEEA